MDQREGPTHPAVAAVQAALDRAVDEIRREPDPDAAFRHATQLWALLRRYIDTVIAQLRVRLAERVRDAHDLTSSAKLARRLGVSRQRLDQMGVKSTAHRGSQDDL